MSKGSVIQKVTQRVISGIEQCYPEMGNEGHRRYFAGRAVRKELVRMEREGTTCGMVYDMDSYDWSDCLEGRVHHAEAKRIVTRAFNSYQYA